jgi:hypothetical protein
MTKDVVYFKLPKNGSTTIRDLFKNYQNLFFFHDYAQFESDIEPNRKNLIKFTTIRNPYSRAVSSWKHCLKEKWIENISLMDFLNLNFSQHNQVSVYSMPQIHYIKFLLKNDIDFVLKLENIEEEFKKFLPFVTFTKIIYNKGNYEPYHLSNDEIEKINQVFDIDFKMLGYNKK